VPAKGAGGSGHHEPEKPLPRPIDDRDERRVRVRIAAYRELAQVADRRERVKRNTRRAATRGLL
jgi:hypothetical protein